MTSWIIWALLGLGIIYLITEAAIAVPARVFIARRGVFWRTLIYCQSCTGFWVGLALAFGHPHPQSPAPLALAAATNGLMMMALAHTWSAWKGGNGAWATEAAIYEEATDAHDEDE